MVVEKLIVNYLDNHLDVPVRMFRPESNPNPEMLSYVIVQKVGGSRFNLLRHATVALQTYAPTAEAAAELMEEVIDQMDQIVAENEISQADLESGPYPFPLTASKQPRYQAVYAITHY